MSGRIASSTSARRRWRFLLLPPWQLGGHCCRVPRLRRLRARRSGPRRPIRRVVLRRGEQHPDLLSAQLSGPSVQGPALHVLRHLGSGPACRLSGLQAMPARCESRLPGVERPRGRCRSCDAADRGRRRRSGGRHRSCRQVGLQSTAGRAAAGGRAGRRTAGSGACPASADRSHVDRVDHLADERDRYGRRFLQHQVLQRHGAVGLRNDTVALRQHAIRGTGSAVGAISVRLPFRRPLAAERLLEDLASSAIPGLEQVSARLTAVRCACPQVRNRDPRTPIQPRRLPPRDRRPAGPRAGGSRCRWMLDLDADPVAADEVLSRDRGLAPLVSGCPGRRVPHLVDGAEVVTRLLLGPPCAGHAAAPRPARSRSTGKQWTIHTDSPVCSPVPRLWPARPGSYRCTPSRRAFPSALLLTALAQRSWDLGAGADWSEVRARLSGLPGVPRLVVDSVAHRGLGDPDAFPLDRRRPELGQSAYRGRRRASAGMPGRGGLGARMQRSTCRRFGSKPSG